MGKLIAIVGNIGTGKTTLALKLCAAGGYRALLEQHKQRPFQERFSAELQKFSLVNQFDYMLFRAEQELYARHNELTAVQDGGLDQDFHVFSRLFRRKGYLEEEEFRLCERLYSTLRQILPYPDLFIKLSAPKAILAERQARRKRGLDIAGAEDLDEMERLIEDWLPKMDPVPVIPIDSSRDDPSYEGIVGSLVERINHILKGS